MTLDVGGVLRDAWRLARRDHQILVAVAGLLLFVPQFAAFLFWSPPPAFPGLNTDPRVSEAFLAASQAWLVRNGPGLLLAAILALIAQISIIRLYVDPLRPDVAGALLGALPMFFPALLAGIIAMPMDLTLRIVPLLILLGAYLQGRLFIVLPVLLGERPVSVVGAVRASWRRTQGHGLVMAGVACIAVLAGPILATPFLLIGRSFGGAPTANPVAAALLDGGAALGVSAGAVAALLLQVAAYRRLSKGM